MPEIKLRTENLLNYSEAARLLNVTRVTIYAMIKRGQFNPVVIADRRYLLKEEVEKVANAKKEETIEDIKMERAPAEATEAPN